jgi:hypothetical protein
LKGRYQELCAKWRITYPLHSSEIRSRVENFRWLRQCSDAERAEFFEDIGKLVTSSELAATACVIDRPGYNHRYREKYGRARWLLCKTAFTVVVERSAKFARDSGCRLRIYVEKSDKKTDRLLRDYYEELRTTGHPFDEVSASKYVPLTAAELRETLYEFKTKDKSSPLMQIADVLLWPMCIGGYDRSNRSYTALKDAGTLIDCKLAPEDLPHKSIKYSCWDLEIERERRKDQSPIGGSG